MNTKEQSIVKKDNALPAELLEDMEGFGADFGSDEVTLPFVRIVQKMSPYLVEGDANYIEGCKAGQLVHTVDNKSYDSLMIIPLRFEHLKIQWRMREHGGGLVQVFKPTDPDLPATHKVEYQNIVTDEPDTVLEDTMQYVCKVLTADCEDIGMAVVSCSKSGLKFARKWNVQLQTKKLQLSNGRVIRAPLFSHMYPLSTLQETNNKNGMTQSWHSFKFGEGVVLEDSELLQACIDLAKQVNDSSFATAVDAPQDSTDNEATNDFKM